MEEWVDVGHTPETKVESCSYAMDESRMEGLS